MHGLSVAGVRGCGETSTDVTLTEMTLEGGVGEVVVGWRVGWRAEISGCESVCRGMGRVRGVAIVFTLIGNGRRVEGGTIEVFGGGDSSRISHKNTLGRLGSGIRRMRGGRGY